MASLIIRMVLSSETKVGIMAGCGGSYELGCRGSLALVDEEGEASGACADVACADGGCAGGACTGGGCTDGACADGACTDGPCVGGVGRLGRGSSFKACGPITSSS